MLDETEKNVLNGSARMGRGPRRKKQLILAEQEERPAGGAARGLPPKGARISISGGSRDMLGPAGQEWTACVFRHSADER